MKNNNPIRKNPLPMFLRKKMDLGGDDFQLAGDKTNPLTWQSQQSPIVSSPYSQNKMYRIPEENRIQDVPSFSYRGNGESIRQDRPLELPSAIDSLYVANVGMRGLSEIYARNQQEQYQQANTANPLANLPFNDGRSDRVKYGYEQFAEGGTLPHVTVTGHKDQGTRKFFDNLKESNFPAYQALTEMGQERGFMKTDVHNRAGRADFNGDKANLYTLGQFENGNTELGRSQKASGYSDDEISSALLTKQYLAEYAHHEQAKTEVPFFSKLKLIKDHTLYGEGAYDRPGTIENDAHRVIEPVLKDEYYKRQGQIKTDMGIYRKGGEYRGIFAEGGTKPPPNVIVNTPKSGVNTDNDTMVSYFNYIKSIQNNNQDGANMALTHIRDIRGPQMATNMQFLGKQLGTSNIQDIAKRSLNETDPQMRGLYATLRENPRIIDTFDYYTEHPQQQQSPDLANKFDQGGLWNNNKSGWVDSVNNANMNKDFVQRLYGQNNPSIQVQGQPSRSTHLMAYDPASRRVYPEVVRENGKLRHLVGDQAYDYADRNKEFIQFQTPEQAEWYSTDGYKTGKNVLNSIDEKGHPYNNPNFKKQALGGMSASEAYKSIYGDDDEKQENSNSAIKQNTAPTEEEVEPQVQQEQEDDTDAIYEAMRMQDEAPYAMQSNPYKEARARFTSSGKYGTKNISPIGQQIASELSSDLGYTPKFNSIYRDPAQQAALIKQGYGVKNSYHLTGSAVDMSPSDWANLSASQQAKYKNKYDVISHNNHVHLEPRG